LGSQFHLSGEAGSSRGFTGNRRAQHHAARMHFQRAYLVVELLFLVFRNEVAVRQRTWS